MKLSKRHQRIASLALLPGDFERDGDAARLKPVFVMTRDAGLVEDWGPYAIFAPQGLSE